MRNAECGMRIRKSGNAESGATVQSSRHTINRSGFRIPRSDSALNWFRIPHSAFRIASTLGRGEAGEFGLRRVDLVRAAGGIERVGGDRVADLVSVEIDGVAVVDRGRLARDDRAVAPGRHDRVLWL